MTAALTPEQQGIIEFGDGPAVVIAGAGTGKTRVIVERVRWLLGTKGTTTADSDGRPLAAEPTRASDPDRPFDGPLLPEQILVLTYNVKAARELQDRLDATVGAATRARMTVSNFHSFCQRVLTESAGDAGLPPRPDVLDGVAQVLLLKSIRHQLPLIYHGDWMFGSFVQFINRAKDELVTPDDFDTFVATERQVFEERYGSFDAAAARLELNGNLKPLRDVRGVYAGLRANERAEASGEPREFDPESATKRADREARRTMAGDGYAHPRSYFEPDDHPRIDQLADTYVVDGAALEVLRLTEMATVYHAYETELARRGALDYGEQIAAVTRLFKTRPNVLRRWQRQFRYLLIDEFQDANVAQIDLIELLGRTPDRPDNVMVVGDDDQSIYRFRGASFAAFAEFETRFSRAPAHDRHATPPARPPRMRLEQNFRSVGRVVTTANRLIAHNETRFEAEKRLFTDRADGEPVQLLICAGAEDEAVAVVDAIQRLTAPETGRQLSDVAVLYRKHKHRDAIVARLRDEDIPYTVVGGLSLFEAPEIRDLEQSLRAIVDPHDDPALVRMMSAGPWRLDALEILRLSRMAKFERAHLFETAKAIVATGALEIDDLTAESTGFESPRRTTDVPPVMRSKLRMLVGVLDELNPLTFREGPFTIVQGLVERTSLVLDLIAADTLEAKRMVTNIASFLRFASDWQAANGSGTLAGFVGYLDEYKIAGGELPTSVELTEDIDGVRLMTLYQAKGLEFPIVIVPSLVDGEWPTKAMSNGSFPRELLREAIPTGDIHSDEERRLLYVAITRAQETLILTTDGGPAARKAASRFIGELLDGAGEELVVLDRTEPTPATAAAQPDLHDEPTNDAIDDRVLADVRRVMPLPTTRERRLALRLRASELVSLLESTNSTNPESAAARDQLATSLADVGRNATMAADEARALGLDPMTFRSVALDSGVGANLLQVAPLPRTSSYSSLSTYERCPLQYAFNYVYRMPGKDERVAAFEFGSTAHEAFEAFTKDRRDRLARGEAPPTREDLDREFRSRWVPTSYGDQPTEERYQRRTQNLLDNFWNGEVSNLGEAINEELDFALTLDPGDGSPPVIITGQIDRIDRLPSGGIEVVDYKTGKMSSQADVQRSLQLSIYALACRDALGLGTPELVTLYFTESATRMSTTRTDEQLDAAREDILARVALMRSGQFTASPGRACQWCDYAAICPERAS